MFLSKLFKRLREPRIAPRNFRIVLHAHGFTVTWHAGTSEVFPWTEIVEGVAFKRDCFSVDQINLEFRFAAGGFLCVNEDMSGWTDLVNALPEVLPGARHFETDWFHEVSQPPFGHSRTQVYSRDC